MESEEKLSAERSLRIICDAIEQNRRDELTKVRVGLLLWGALICVSSVVIGALLSCTGNNRWNYLWIAVVVIGRAFQIWFNTKKGLAETPTTFVGKVISYIWQVSTASIFIVFLISHRVEWSGEFDKYVPFYPVTILILNFSTLLMGMILKSKAISYCASFSYALVIISLYKDIESQVISVFITSLVTLIVPGIILMVKAKRAAVVERKA